MYRARCCLRRLTRYSAVSAGGTSLVIKRQKQIHENASKHAITSHEEKNTMQTCTDNLNPPQPQPLKRLL
jgi:hypothetical protein